MGGSLPRNFPINWCDGKQNDLVRNWISFLLLAFAIFIWFEDIWYLSCGLILCLLLIFLWLHNLIKFKFYRVFMDEYSESMDMIDSILTFKGIPFERKKNQFYVENVEIELNKYTVRRIGDFGTQITISSTDKMAKPLIDSLMQKIDETFLFE